MIFQVFVVISCGWRIKPFHDTTGFFLYLQKKSEKQRLYFRGYRRRPVAGKRLTIVNDFVVVSN